MLYAFIQIDLVRCLLWMNFSVKQFEGKKTTVSLLDFPESFMLAVTAWLFYDSIEETVIFWENVKLMLN